MGLRRSFKPTNLVQNGNFANGTTNWNTVPALGGTISATNNVLTATIKESGIGVIARNTLQIKWKSDNKYFFRAKIRAINTSMTDLLLRVGNNTANLNELGNVANPIQNTWYVLSNIFVPSSGNVDNNISIWASVMGIGGQRMEVQEVMAIDLTTAFGAGNEPDKAWCDLNIPNWFDGTMSGGSFGSIGGLK